MGFFSASFAAAQTNYTLVLGQANKKIVVTRYIVSVDNDSTDVGWTLGFGASTITSPFAAHPNLPSGLHQGEIFTPQSAPAGAVAESWLFTCSVPTGGTVRVSGSYEIHDFTKGHGA